MTAKAFHAVERRLSVLFPDDFAELATEQPQQFAAGGIRRLLRKDDELPFGHDVTQTLAQTRCSRRPATRFGGRPAVYPAAVPPTVRLSIRSVGCPTPTGTL